MFLFIYFLSVLSYTDKLFLIYTKNVFCKYIFQLFMLKKKILVVFLNADNKIQLKHQKGAGLPA